MRWIGAAGLVLVGACERDECGDTRVARDTFATQYGTRLHDYFTTCLEPGTYAPDTLDGVVDFVETRSVLLERCGGTFDACAAATCFEELAAITDCSLPVGCELDGTIFAPGCPTSDTGR